MTDEEVFDETWEEEMSLQRCPYTDHLCTNAWDCANCDVTADVRKWEHDEEQEDMT